GGNLRFDYCGCHRDSCGRSGTNHFRTEFLCYKRNVADMVDMAVAGKDKIGFGYYACDSLLIGFPFSTQDRFATRKKRVDEYDCLSVANLPTCVAQPLENDGLFLRRMIVWRLTDRF